MNLQGLKWNAFSVTPGTSVYGQITPPSFVVNKITTKMGAAQSGISQMILTVASGVLPAWAVPGAGVNVNITKAGVTSACAWTIRDVTATTVTLAAPVDSDQVFTATYTNASLDAVAGSVVNTVTLVIQCQKAIFNCPTGSAASTNVAPVADSNGANAPYVFTLAAGTTTYELDAPVGAKFDLADFWIYSTGSSALNIMFL